MPSKKKLREAAVPNHAETAALAVEQAIAFLTPYLESARDNIGPAAKQAATRSVELALKAKEAAGPTAKLAAERGLDLAHRAADAAGPSAKVAADRGLEFASKARENLEPHVIKARGNLEPHVAKAFVALEPHVSKARESLEPHVADALTRVSPHVDQARAKVQQDLVPKLTELLNEAEQHPAVQQAKQKGAATLAKVTGTEVEVAKPKRRVGRTIARVIAAGALLAGAAVAVRQFLGAKDEAWTAPPAPSSPQATSTPVYTSTSADTSADEVVTDDSVVGESAIDETGADELGGESGEGDQPAARSHGEGSFVGENPPEGFEIKGNERSMKYHVPTSGGYDRTIADVWFVSEEAATAAGFTRAQR